MIFDPAADPDDTPLSPDEAEFLDGLDAADEQHEAEWGYLHVAVDGTLKLSPADTWMEHCLQQYEDASRPKCCAKRRTN